MALSTGQITIIDYNDAITLTSFLSCNVSKTQIYDPDSETYIPDWTVSPFCVLQAQLYKAGSGSDIITDATSVVYKKIVNGTETTIGADSTHVYSGAKNQILTIKANEMTSSPTLEIACIITYTDATTGLALTSRCSISFSKATNGVGITQVTTEAPNGNIFKNDQIASLTALAKLYRGGTIDTTDVTYKWYIQDPNSTDPDAGAGWKALTNTSGKWTGVTTNTLTIYAAAVTNLAVFKVGISDTTTPSPYTKYWDTIVFQDVTDPITCTITSTGGEIFKNGDGETDLTAHIYQNGTEIDTAGTGYLYKWYKYDKNGDLVSNWGGSGIDYRTGKTLSGLDGDDVDVKATFLVEIEETV